MSSRKTTLITDLDNTLFDWVELWFNCFSPMLDEIVRISGVPKDTLIPEIACVHQTHGTSEYSFLIEELPSVLATLNGRLATEVFASAIETYRKNRRLYLKLYPTVAETLLKIKGKGATIIGYTVSMAFYSNYRVRRLGLDGVIDYIYSPEDHKLPKDLSPDNLRKYPAQNYTFKYTQQEFTPQGSKKPDSIVLDSIVDGLQINKSDCVYIGDSLMKDVTMAIDCGVDAVWAKDGVARNAGNIVFSQVTHWTTEDVIREQTTKEREHVSPNFVLSASFFEILNLFDFSDRV